VLFRSASQSRMDIQPETPGVEDIIDSIVAGVRSSMTYAGSRDIKQFQDRAVVGVQSASGYQEGQAVETNWS
jgi:IMP dehydrogenase